MSRGKGTREKDVSQFMCIGSVTLDTKCENLSAPHRVSSRKEKSGKKEKEELKKKKGIPHQDPASLREHPKSS